MKNEMRNELESIIHDIEHVSVLSLFTLSRLAKSMIEDPSDPVDDDLYSLDMFGEAFSKMIRGYVSALLSVKSQDEGEK